MTLTDEIQLLMAAPSMNAKDMRTLLRRGHDELLTLARDLADCESGDERRALLKQLNLTIFAHTRSEQREVYDFLLREKRSDEAREIALEGYVSHGVIDDLLARMTKSRKSESDEWKAHAQVLLELIGLHVEKEGRGLLKLLGEQFSDDEREAMYRRFVACRSRLATKVKEAAEVAVITTTA